MTDPAPARRGRLWQTALGVTLSVVALVWALKGVRFSELAEYLSAAAPWPIVAGVVIATLTFVLRIPRWRLLLRREDGSALPPGPLWHAIAMGFMANNILPFRAGELIRTYAASRLTRTRFTAALSSIAVERVFDGLAAVLLLSLSLFLVRLPEGTTLNGTPLSSIATRAGVLFAVALALAGLVVAWPRYAERVVERVIPFAGLRVRLVAAIEGIAHGLSVLRSPVQVVAVLLWSLVIWLVNAFSFYVMFRAFGIEVNYAGALLLQGVLLFGISVPSTPGYVGVFEFAATAALALFGVPKDQALAYALTYHVTTFLPITLLGLWSVVRTNLGLRDLRERAAA